VPKCIQETLITVPTVEEIVRVGNNEIGTKEALKLAEKTCRCAKQLFAILACINKGPEICSLLAEGISDTDLPFRRTDNNREPFELQRKGGESIETLKSDKWTEDDLEQFGSKQFWMTAPIFEDKRHYELHDNTILPFLHFEPSKIPMSIQGGYSEVYPVRVHPSHHQFWSSEPKVMEC
jgi:hypothetical protein